MIRLIQAEYIKGRRSFARKSLVLFPLLITLMAVFLMGGQFVQVGAFNWWCVMLLPTVLSLCCINLIDPERRNGFYNVSSLPISKGKLWTAKVLTGCSYLLAGNLAVFAGTTISSMLYGTLHDVLRGLGAAAVLTLAWMWQVPLWMFVSTKLSSVATLLGALACNFICSGQDIAGGHFWFIPFAIPTRLMSPIIGINPNGVLLEAGSPLWDTGVILPGLIITTILFVVLLASTSRWFDRRSE